MMLCVHDDRACILVLRHRRARLHVCYCVSARSRPINVRAMGASIGTCDESNNCRRMILLPGVAPYVVIEGGVINDEA